MYFSVPSVADGFEVCVIDPRAFERPSAGLRNISGVLEFADAGLVVPMNTSPLDALRTDKNSGAVAIVFGLCLVSFALCGLLMVGMQRMLLKSMPPAPPIGGVSVPDAMRAMHGVWCVYLPILIAGGIVFAVTGIYVLQGSIVARRISQMNSICGYLWVTAYSISCFRISEMIAPLTPFIGESANQFLRLIWCITGWLVGAIFPTTLLFILSRPRRAVERQIRKTNDLR